MKKDEINCEAAESILKEKASNNEKSMTKVVLLL